MDMGSGFGLFFGLTLLLPVALLGLAVLGVVAIAGGREPDPSGQRQRATYLAAVCFVSLITVLFAGYGAVSSIFSLIGEDDGEMTVRSSATMRGSGSASASEGGSFSTDEGESFSFDNSPSVFEEEDENRTEEAVSGMVAGLVVLLAAGALYVYHRRLMDEVIDAPDFATGPARRAINGYAYAVSFVTALVALGAAAAALYAVYRVAAPDFSAPDAYDERGAGLRQLLSSAFLAFGAMALFQLHFGMGERWTRPLPAPAPGAAPDSDTELPPIA